MAFREAVVPPTFSCEKSGLNFCVFIADSVKSVFPYPVPRITNPSITRRQSVRGKQDSAEKDCQRISGCSGKE
jgi:hypothetical protein